LAEFTEFAMPNPMGRCDQCHETADSYALPDGTQRAAVVRKQLNCSGTNVDGWCTGRTVAATVYTPPLKAVCTSCHDSAVTNTHADLFTTNPMSQTAVEHCASCHGPGTTLDSKKVHGHAVAANCTECHAAP
jgi:hypothetical protein